MLPQEMEGQRFSLCDYPEPVDEGREDERDGCEEDTVARKREAAAGWGCAFGADCGGETEWSRSRKGERTARPTEEEVSQLHGRTILNTAFHAVFREKRGGRSHPDRKKKRETETE